MINAPALRTLLARAGETHSSALAVLHQGTIVGSWSWESDRHPVQTMSCTKSIVSLAVGTLVDDGVLSSIDVPVHTLYPEWKQGRKQRITVRHLLNHTSGLRNEPNTTVDIEGAPDIVRLALAAELVDEPGARFAYNNKAVNLLAGVVERLSGRRLDHYVHERLLKRMGVTDMEWTLDPAGTPFAMAGLALHAADLLKVGQLVLQGGEWEGNRLVRKQWLDLSLAQGQPLIDRCGLLWWRLPAYEHFDISTERFAELLNAGAEEAFLTLLRPLANHHFNSRPSYHAALAALLGPEWMRLTVEHLEQRRFQLSTRTAGPIVGYEANGWLGQSLVILPEARLVAARLIRNTAGYDATTDGFEDFVDCVRAVGGV